MARSQLMGFLQRLASEHAEASKRGIEVESVRRERAAGSTDRRRFLQGVGALAGVAALSPAAMAASKATKSKAKPRIAVIGAGIAGLNAASVLQAAGLSFTVYEASNRIGGRMHSDTTTWRNGQQSEWCGELIDSDHTTILNLAKKYKLKIIDNIAAQPSGSTDTLYFKGNYYSQAQADIDFAPVSKVLQHQVNAAGYPTLYNSYNSTGLSLDNLSIYNWIEQYVPGGHQSALGLFLDSAYKQEYGLDTQYQSSLNLVYLLGYQPVGPWQIFGSSDERYRIAGGNQTLPTAIAGSLPAGSVVTQWALTNIAQATGGSYTLQFKTPGGQTSIVADEVILALPFSVLRKINYSLAGFNSRKQFAIQNLGYGTNSKLVLQFDNRYWNTKGPWGVGDGSIFTDLFFQNTWDSSRGFAGSTGLLTGYTGGSNGASFSAAASPYASATNDPSIPASADPTVRNYAQNFLLQLNQVWPGVSQHWNGLATLSTPWRDPNLLGSYSCWKVGQYTTVAGYERVRQGNCHFAGEHCSIDYQGYMEGAAREGARAANEIISDYMA